MRELRVGIIGHKFMGKAHSNAWKRAPEFFAMAARPVLQVACGRNQAQLAEFAAQWGWRRTEQDWRQVVQADDVDIVDICTPTCTHFEIAMAAIKAGKHVFCEKPLALTAAEAEQLWLAAQASGVTHYLNHNYRRCPAVRLARQLIDEGRIGRIFHWRGAYLQSWIVDPAFPLTWHLRKETAGSGPQADLNSHSVDLARYLVGDIKRVTGMTGHFITERPLADAAVAGTFKGGSLGSGMGKVTVEDASFMLVEFENGALGSFEASRFALGRKNYNTFEIYGDKGSILFDLERMNELSYFSADDPEYAQGFRTIQATEACHEYMSHWWPAGHIIGYEHGFVHAVVDFVAAVQNRTRIRPDFYDGMMEMQVLEAGLASAATGRTLELG
jgi:predicted dehydrogenase